MNEQTNATERSQESVVSVRRNELIERHEDMSPDGKLVLLLQPDGDVIVNVRPSKSDRDYEGSPFGVTVEFCSIGAGGGRSPHTLKALRDLIVAMAKDNVEHPVAH